MGLSFLALYLKISFFPEDNIFGFGWGVVWPAWVGPPDRPPPPVDKHIPVVVGAWHEECNCKFIHMFLGCAQPECQRHTANEAASGQVGWVLTQLTCLSGIPCEPRQHLSRDRPGFVSRIVFAMATGVTEDADTNVLLVNEMMRLSSGSSSISNLLIFFLRSVPKAGRNHSKFICANFFHIRTVHSIATTLILIMWVDSKHHP